MESLANLRIVLVRPTHPGNVGATARAMKNMGLRELCLVEPTDFPGEVATRRASGAEDILEAAVIVPDLASAIADCRLAMGTSGRSRKVPWPVIDAREAAERAVGETESGKVALVFGQERIGLTNRQLERCQVHVAIPSDPEFHSLNLAAAVQVMCYELRVAALARGDEPAVEPAESGEEPATVGALGEFFEHLEATLWRIGFLRDAGPSPERVMRRLIRFYTRARPDRRELAMLRGVLARVDRARGPGAPPRGDS